MNQGVFSLMITRSSSLATRPDQTLTPEPQNPAHDSAQIPESVPHFTSFAHITDPRVRRAKEYEQFLLFNLERFPDYRARIEQEIEWTRKLSSGRGPASDQDRILQSLEAWHESTCQEVAEDTGLPYSTVYKLLRRMLDKGVVMARSQSGLGNKPCLVYAAQSPR
jgi:hypothetical protein